MPATSWLGQTIHLYLFIYYIYFLMTLIHRSWRNLKLWRLPSFFSSFFSPNESNVWLLALAIRVLMSKLHPCGVQSTLSAVSYSSEHLIGVDCIMSSQIYTSNFFFFFFFLGIVLVRHDGGWNSIRTGEELQVNVM